MSPYLSAALYFVLAVLASALVVALAYHENREPLGLQAPTQVWEWLGRNALPVVAGLLLVLGVLLGRAITGSPQR
jgi:hypothetical protein